MRTETFEDAQAEIPEKPVVLAAGVSVINPTFPKQAISRTSNVNKINILAIVLFHSEFKVKKVGLHFATDDNDL